MKASTPPDPHGRRGAGRPAPAGPHILAFALVVVASVVAVTGYAVHLIWRNDAQQAAAPPVATVVLEAIPAALEAAAVEAAAVAGPAASVPAPAASSGVAPAAARPYVLFRSTALGHGHGRVSLVYLDAPDDARSVGALQCDRVHFSAGIGICLEALRSGIVSYRAHLFNADFEILHTLPLAGPPSRARVSPDGRLAAFTVFISGHSYSSPGFVTRTSVVDTGSGKPVFEDLERLQVQKDGAPFQAADFNLWGVTFARDGRRFYATLGSAGKLYLVEGDIAAARMRVVHDDVECPSLSPDNRKVAFKRRAPMDSAGRRTWRLVVLDLASGKETLLDKEARNVDDQVEWLSDHEILYALPRTEQQSTAGTDVWALGVDAKSAPRRLLPFAFSPAVMR